jgi:outer membrane protein assembly factor BamB
MYMKLNRYIDKISGTAARLILLLTILIIVLLIDTNTCKSRAEESPWPMFRHDLKHTGYTPYTGPATPTVAWIFPATDGIVSSPTIGTDGTIYFGAGWHFNLTTDNHLYALNHDGSLKWSFEGGGGFFSSPALGQNNTLYITCLDGYLYAIEDMGTYGEQKWRTYLDYYFNLSSPAIGEDSTVYVGSPSFRFYSLNSDNGSINWNWITGWCIISSPAISDDGIVYIGSKYHNLYAFDNALEEPIWQFFTGTFYDGHLVDSSPAIGTDGTIYIGTDPYGAAGQEPILVDTNFWAVNPDGTLKWSFDTEDGVESSPAIGPDGTIYFGSYDNHLYAVTDNGSEGVLKWKFPTDDSIDGSPTVDGDGVIYFGSRDSKLYALYPNGTVKWTFQAGDGFECSPTIDDKGYLYIGSFDGNLYALGTGAPDVGVAFVDVPSQVIANSNYVPKATIRNYRSEAQNFNVTCVIDEDQETIYTDTITVSIPGGSSSQKSFSPWHVGPDIDVNYTVTVTTLLPSDENIDNNERSILTVSIIDPEAIPTLTEWGLIIFMTVIMGIGVMVLRKRRMA